MSGPADESVEVPPFHAFLRPALVVLEHSDQRAARDIVSSIAMDMGLTQTQLAQTIASGQSRVRNRVLWALSYLFQAGAVNRPQRGQYRISDRGRSLLAACPDVVTVADLRQFAEFREFVTRTQSSSNELGVEDAIEVETITPLEQIESASRILDRSVAADVIERIRQQPPAFLEKAVVQLLIAMGYGGTHGDGQHLGGASDGGFDGVINQDPLGLGRVYVQAKRYAPENVVGRPTVQGFLGALHAEGAAGGVLITTSSFSSEAIVFVASVSPRIILIDGSRLGELLVSYRIGVQDGMQ